MPGYTTRLVPLQVGGQRYTLRALSDRQQFADHHGLAQKAGIPPALWSLFGQMWPAGRVLARAMADIDIRGKRILEIGCGLALSSIVLHRRGADVLASDHHPLAEPFLRYNAGLNALTPVPYCSLPWDEDHPALGHFDLIIGSDVLYERDHAALLAAFVSRHACAHGEIVITDPGRGNSGAFTNAMLRQGYSVAEHRSPFDDADVPPYRGRLLSYRR